MGVFKKLFGGKKEDDKTEEVVQKLMRDSLLAASRGETGPDAADRIIAESMAELGSPVETYNLGVRYAQGDGVPQNWARAVECYRKAADMGLAESQVNLGMCYAEGKGIAQDYTEALRWFRKAAAQGDSGGCFKLGIMYANGWGVKQDYDEAFTWVNRAAEKGNAEALAARPAVSQRAVLARARGQRGI